MKAQRFCFAISTKSHKIPQNQQKPNFVIFEEISEEEVFEEVFEETRLNALPAGRFEVL